MGRSALTDNGAGAAQAQALDADMATLARGGRLNVFGFVLRLAARVPFLTNRKPDAGSDCSSPAR